MAAMTRRKFAHPGRGACVYCGRKLKKANAFHKDGYTDGLATTRDHLHPLSEGGTGVRECCRACNQVKGNLPETAWRTFMETHPRWWKLYPRETASTVIRKEGGFDLRSGD